MGVKITFGKKAVPEINGVGGGTVLYDDLVSGAIKAAKIDVSELQAHKLYAPSKIKPENIDLPDLAMALQPFLVIYPHQISHLETMVKKWVEEELDKHLKKDHK